MPGQPGPSRGQKLCAMLLPDLGSLCPAAQLPRPDLRIQRAPQNLRSSRWGMRQMGEGSTGEADQPGPAPPTLCERPLCANPAPLPSAPAICLSPGSQSPSCQVCSRDAPICCESEEGSAEPLVGAGGAEPAKL